MAIDSNTQINPDGVRRTTVASDFSSPRVFSRLIPGTQIDMLTGKRIPIDETSRVSMTPVVIN